MQSLLTKILDDLVSRRILFTNFPSTVPNKRSNCFATYSHHMYEILHCKIGYYWDTALIYVPFHHSCNTVEGYTCRSLTPFSVVLSPGAQSICLNYYSSWHVCNSPTCVLNVQFISPSLWVC